MHYAVWCHLSHICMPNHVQYDFFCVGVVYSGEYDVCDVTLSVYPHRASLKNMPGHGGNRTYDLWNASPMLCQLSYAVRSVRVCDISELSLVPSTSMQSNNHDFFVLVLVLCTQVNMMFVMSLWVCIHTGQSWKNITVGIEPTTFGMLAHHGQAYFSSLSGVDTHSE